MIVGASDLIKVDEQSGAVSITSPTFGDTIKILKPTLRFGSSQTCLKDLKHVENQIKSMSVMPDFGYAEDNYLIDNDNNNKWKTICSLIGDNERFSWLMNYIQLSKLETTIEKEEERVEA